jgi:hypothetical protein
MLKIKLLILFFLLPAILWAAQPEWNIFKSTHFLVYYKQAPESLLEQITQKAEDCYEAIAQEFGFNRVNFWSWDNRAKIYLFDNQEDYKNANANYMWSAGNVIVVQKKIQTYVGASGLVDDVLVHEIAHIIFKEMVGYNNPGVPLWLDEGVASFQQQGQHLQGPLLKKYLSGMIKSGSFMSIEQLSAFDLVKATEQHRVLFYREAYSLLNYLVASFGKDKFVQFCQFLRDHKDLARAFRFAYSFDSLMDLEDSWKVYILQ